MNTVSFFIASFIIILLPGTGVIYTISTGLSFNRRAGILAAFGCTLGILPHLLTSIFFSALLFHEFPQAFLFIRIAGALYLLFLGVNMFFAKGEVLFEEENEQKKSRQLICRGILINLLNPKLTLFFFSFLPQYVSPDSSNYHMGCLLYGGLFMLITFLVFLGYAILANTAKLLFLNSPKLINYFNKLFGLIFLIFSVKLLLK